jgi:hypothetical protein
VGKLGRRQDFVAAAGADLRGSCEDRTTCSSSGWGRGRGSVAEGWGSMLSGTLT